MSWTSRSAPSCNHIPFCHSGRCSKTLPNRYCFTPSLATWLFHLPSETVRVGTSLPQAGVSSYIPFPFSYTKTVPGSLLGGKGLHTSAEVSSLAGGTIHPVAADYFFSLIVFFQVPLLLKKNYVYHEQRNPLMHGISQKLHSYQRFLWSVRCLSVGPDTVI